MAAKSIESKMVRQRLINNLINELRNDTRFKTLLDVKYYIANEILGISYRTLERALEPINEVKKNSLFPLDTQIKLNL